MQGWSRFKQRLVSGLFDLIVFGILLDGGHGAFDIIHLISKRFDTLISPGTLYPRLRTLEKLELISEASDGRRKIFMLTPQGRQVISLAREEYDRLHSSVIMLTSHERGINTKC